ncbi:uncharacterized protein LOC141654953 [Silene latifolia]|uniref:uncharacterized protein LOC141654953 n=1 Tax=Silene latifolia TaxID=37657 RepID=UPI003D788120
MSHNLPFRNPMDKMPLQVITLPQYPTRQVSEFSPFAEIALAYFNCVQNVDFKLVEVTRVGYDISYPKSTMHVNFDAKSKSGKVEMFYAELKTPSLNKVDEKGIVIQGCALLKKVDTGNPLGISCMICHDKVIHPGPKDGYNVVLGDKFKDSRFWLYRPSTGLNCSTIREDTIRYMDKYLVFAMKAVKHLNCKVEADWELLVVTRVIDRMEKCRIIFHMNFTVKSSNFNNETKLCFAEFILPLFSGHSPDNWTMEKEPFLEVIGCCIMEKDANYESSFGRVCAMCTSGLIHPGPKYGYRVLARDDFAMYDFKACGNGVF